MKIPTDTQFMFFCEEHGAPLTMPYAAHGNAYRTPRMKHPSTEASAVWVFDLTSARCYGNPNQAPEVRIGDECRKSWRITA